MPRLPQKYFHIAFCAVAQLCAAGTIAAPTTSQIFFEAETRDLRFENQRTDKELQFLQISEKAQQQFSVSGTIGASSTRSDDGDRTLLTPFEVATVFNNDPQKTVLSFSGDGYGSIRSTSGNSYGFNDTSIDLSRMYFIDEEASSYWRFGAGVRLPMGGEFGSTSATQSVSASFSKDFGNKWNLVASGQFAHLNAEQTSGLSHFGEAAALQVAYELPGVITSPAVSHDLALLVVRAIRSGAGGSTQAGFVYNFPIGNSKKIGGALSFIHATSSGLQDNSIEFDLSYAF